MNPKDKPLVWLHGEVRTPPLSRQARLGAGHLLRLLQGGSKLDLPHSRSMPAVGPRCHELRINDAGTAWRIVYRVDPDALVIVGVFRKTTTKTPGKVIETCRTRLRAYDHLADSEDS